MADEPRSLGLARRIADGLSRLGQAGGSNKRQRTGEWQPAERQSAERRKAAMEQETQPEPDDELDDQADAGPVEAIVAGPVSDRLWAAALPGVGSPGPQKFWLGAVPGRLSVVNAIVRHGGVLVSEEAARAAPRDVVCLIERNAGTRSGPAFLDFRYIQDSVDKGHALEMGPYLLREAIPEPHQLPYGPPPARGRNYSQEEDTRMIQFCLDQARNGTYRELSRDMWEIAVQLRVTDRPMESMRNRERTLSAAVKAQLKAEGLDPQRASKLRDAASTRASPPRQLQLTGGLDTTQEAPVSKSPVPYTAEEDDKLVHFFLAGMREDDSWIDRPKSKEIWTLATELQVVDRTMESMRTRMMSLIGRVREHIALADQTSGPVGDDGLMQFSADTQAQEIFEACVAGPRKAVRRQYRWDETKRLAGYWADQAVANPALRVKPASRVVWQQAQSKGLFTDRSVDSLVNHMKTHLPTFMGTYESKLASVTQPSKATRRKMSFTEEDDDIEDVQSARPTPEHKTSRVSAELPRPRAQGDLGTQSLAILEFATKRGLSLNQVERLLCASFKRPSN